ncbi:MAG: hypothetical protein R3C29_06360 [Dehalococcoidia bacterium]|nr:hypothetical protein [Dehalococcoidia bacterium]MCA9823803.1 hypothetical protein [Dehalococcoidia bacterium]
MALYVAFFRFKPGTDLGAGLEAFERRKAFSHPPRASVLGEYWVQASGSDPQVVLAWEADDEGPGDYYRAAWDDLFDITICPATQPVGEIPAEVAASLGLPAVD